MSPQGDVWLLPYLQEGCEALSWLLALEPKKLLSEVLCLSSANTSVSHPTQSQCLFLPSGQRGACSNPSSPLCSADLRSMPGPVLLACDFAQATVQSSVSLATNWAHWYLPCRPVGRVGEATSGSRTSQEPIPLLLGPPRPFSDDTTKGDETGQH